MFCSFKSLLRGINAPIIHHSDIITIKTRNPIDTVFSNFDVGFLQNINHIANKPRIPTINTAISLIIKTLRSSQYVSIDSSINSP